MEQVEGENRDGFVLKPVKVITFGVCMCVLKVVMTKVNWVTATPDESTPPNSSTLLQIISLSAHRVDATTLWPSQVTHTHTQTATSRLFLHRHSLLYLVCLSRPDDGAVYSFGENKLGQLGQGTQTDAVLSPALVKTRLDLCHSA